MRCQGGTHLLLSVSGGLTAALKCLLQAAKDEEEEGEEEQEEQEEGGAVGYILTF